MTIPRWLLPAFAILTAIAVGIAATLIGMQLRLEQPPTTQTVPVLEPVSIGDAPPITDDDPETLDVSGASGEMEIVTPGTLEEGEVSPGTEERIDALDASDGLDEATAREVVASKAETADPSVGDPCSPPDALTPEGCPDGLRSAIFALTEPGPLRLFPRADPPIVLAGSGGLVACPAAPDGSLSFGVSTTVPAQVTVRYWPVGDPAAEQSVSIDNLPEEVAAWDAVIVEDGGFREGYGLFQHCTTLPDFAPSTRYESSIIAADIFDRVEGMTYVFDSRGAPERPPMVVQPLGPSLVYVSVPVRTAGPLPWVRAWVVDRGDPADCSTWDGESDLGRIATESELEVSAGYLADRNYISAYTRRVSSVFSVPEGSVIVVCARWYDREAPSWRTDVPIEQLSVIVTSPDTLVPVVRLTGLNLARAVGAGTVHIFASSPFGYSCPDRLRLPQIDEDSGTILPVDDLLCAPGSELTGWESGSIGNIVVTSEITGRDGPVTTSRVLPLGRYNCTGVCVLPPTRSYELLLPTVTVGRGLCGSSFGSCTPPTSEIALGTATITVMWEQGATTGASEWEVGESALVIPEDDVPDYPQLDVNNAVTATLDPIGISAFLTVPIEVDRQSNYRVTVEGDCFIDGPPEPAIGETARSVGEFVANVRMNGMCSGQRYRVTVELTDAAGNRSIYGTHQPGPFSWYGASTTVPQGDLAFEGTIDIDYLAGSPQAWWVTGADVQLGDDELGASFPVDTCFTRTERSTAGTFEGITELTPIVPVHIVVAAVTERLYTGVNRDATCGWTDQNWYTAYIDFDVAYTDLLRGVTVTQVMVRPEFPDERNFEVTITLRAKRL
ncbi:MAG: hypothetical protein LH616_02755 [Ilumatobacteraceae bacterium]|nr:hypothetical protein [Ilumatobacteraceae bacterium]